MKQWHDIMAKVLAEGRSRPDRTGIGTVSLFGEQLVFDNSGPFPATTSKRLAIKQVAAELASFLNGHNTLEQFHNEGCTIWDANGNAPYWKPDVHGDLGRIYGVQWRQWRAVDKAGYMVELDQLHGLIQSMRNDPFGRRHMVTAWNPGELSQMCLPPCHVLFQAYVTAEYTVDLRVDMRSVDLFLGLPFDIASYALLQCLLCRTLGWQSGRLIFQLGDAHIYLNHLDAVAKALANPILPGPKLVLADEANLLNFSADMVTLEDYACAAAIPAPMNV